MMKRKRSWRERCESCAYCVLIPSQEKSAFCELKVYGVEMWWRGCKHHITREEIGEHVQGVIQEEEEEERCPKAIP